MKTELPKAEFSQVWDNLGLGLLLMWDMAHCTDTTDNVLIRNEHVITHKLNCHAKHLLLYSMQAVYFAFCRTSFKDL